MSAATEAIGAAVARAAARMAAIASDELPADVAVTPVDGGLRLTGPRLLLRWAEDVRLRGLAATAARR